MNCCNVVLRTVCTLYFNEIQRLSSLYHVYPMHTSIPGLKKLSGVIFLICPVCSFNAFYVVFFYIILYSFKFLSFYFIAFISVFVLPSSVIKID